MVASSLQDEGRMISAICLVVEFNMPAQMMDGLAHGIIATMEVRFIFI